MALPALAAYARQQGYRTLLFDLDLECLLALLLPDSLLRAASALRRKAHDASPDAETARILALSYSLPHRAQDALNVLRSPAGFFNPHSLSSAREVILNALDLSSMACPRPVHYSIEPLRYEVDGFDAARFTDLAVVTADRDANLFADYWDCEFFPALERQRVDLVGISITTRFQLIPSLTLARSLRNRGYFVVLGGSIMPRFAESLRRLPQFFDIFADGVVLGDGESALAELVFQLRGKREFDRVPNYLYCRDRLVHFTHWHFEDVAKLPTPDFSGLPLEKYLVPMRVLPILIARGCYYARCKFCEIPENNRSSEQPYRLRPPETVVSDVLKLARDFGCRHFILGDEAVQPIVMEQLADGLAAAGRFDFRFAAYLRFEPGFTRSLCQKLRLVGLRRALFGLESGSQETLDHMLKGIRLADVRPILENFRAAGIGFLVFAIVGLPEEPEDSALATFRFFEENQDFFNAPGCTFDIRPLELQMGSPYMQQATMLGLHVPAELLARDFVIGVGEQWENTRGLSRLRTHELLSEHSSRLQQIYQRFDSWPSLLWPVWDEWGLLYADEFFMRPFPYSTSLPEHNQGEYGLRWNPAIAIIRDGDEVELASRRGRISLGYGTYAIFEQVGSGTPEVLISRLVPRAQKVSDLASSMRALISRLALAGLLQIVPAPAQAK